MHPPNDEETIHLQNLNLENIHHQIPIDLEQEESHPRENLVIIEEEQQNLPIQEEHQSPSHEEHQSPPSQQEGEGQSPPSLEEEEIPPRDDMHSRNSKILVELANLRCLSSNITEGGQLQQSLRETIDIIVDTISNAQGALYNITSYRESRRCFYASGLSTRMLKN